MNKVWCWLFGHRFEVVQRFSSYSRRIYCSRCKESFAMNDQVRAVIPWDGDVQEMYEIQGKTCVYKQFEKAP